MEYDLFNPAQNLFLGMSVEIGEYQVREQALKSITNRINRANRGIPTSGKLPYGRTWNKEKGWGIDFDKQHTIQQAARRYLNGEGVPEIAKSYQMNASNLHKILTKRSGTKWECRFANKAVNIDETVIMEVPPLLDENTISEIKERTRINITYERGNRKHRYLLGGMIFCEHCGYSMSMYANHSGKRYYRHSKYSKDKCDFNRLIPANEIENSLLIKLIYTFGDIERIEKAIKRATPDLAKVDALSQERSNLTKELKEVINQKERIVVQVAEGRLSNSDIETKMKKLRASESAIKSRLAMIESELSSIPDPSHVKRVSQFASPVIANATKNNPEIIFKRSYNWKRKLIEHAFSGIDSTGKRLGIYVGLKEKQLTFEIHGIFENTINILPLPDDELIEIFKLEPEFQDVKEELKRLRSNIVGKCHAYYRQCFHQ